MRRSVEFILAFALFLLCLGVNEAIAKANPCTDNSHQLKSYTKSATLSQGKSTSDDLQGLRIFGLPDIERVNRPNSTLLEYTQFRFRRLQKITIEIKNIFLQLSFLDNLFALDQNKIFHSDKSPEYAQMTCDYYIFALRRILI